MTDEWRRVQIRLCMNCIKFLVLPKVLVEAATANHQRQMFQFAWQRFGATQVVRNINLMENYEVTCTFIYVCILNIFTMRI